MRGQQLGPDFVLLTGLGTWAMNKMGIYQRDRRNGKQALLKKVSRRGTNAGKNGRAPGKLVQRSGDKASHAKLWRESSQQIQRSQEVKELSHGVAAAERGKREWREEGGAVPGAPAGTHSGQSISGRAGFHCRLNKVRALLSKVAW